ncbi:YacL family protein [Thalassotalea sp. PP2-459]|uniref:UPF0231 family protein n=1 Tax=Thalassotalea sp. PP2-459 TaxID=1742724 RepID=UPI000942EF2B|nr:YacL family protein [Thalassotalea sp. PP2-459]OKY26505.1 hypothetical protein BI291_11845 [Thalassotalea sp. PP2-459]
MEYDFIHDPITGQATANFSLDHQLLGPWLETEIGSDVDKLSNILSAIKRIEQGKEQELMFMGSEYTLTLNSQDAEVNTNVMLNGEVIMPDELAVDALQFDFQEGVSCGVDDLRYILLSWEQFIKTN